ncbi:MAG: cadmium carbonic anhydrase [Proteobacteria bacterium]|nr:cadmium carbonic anhydrase [Pseudomonadota bacterium]NOG60530.1 cadmium carbonic anhydrase [Pseudomonadota bacterium]
MLNKFFAIVLISFYSLASFAESTEICENYGPQAPRDLDNSKGLNKLNFSLAPDYKEMNLCNIHFHKHAEHKAKDFSIYAGEGKEGIGGGYKCNISEKLTNKELTDPGKPVCKNIKPGDTIEVHWVHSSCPVKPGSELGSCLADNCKNPDLRVETQVFTVVNDPDALDFNNFDYDGNIVNGYHQAKALPQNTGNPVKYTGSTTGHSYNNKKCSPLQVSWSVRPQCAKIDINSLGKWCENNEFKEIKAHGVRKLVIDPELLSEIK